MKTLPAYDSLASFPRQTRPVHLAIGMFDGVHIGHVSVLAAARSCSEKDAGTYGVLSFFPHPSRLFRPAEPAQLLMSAETKSVFLVERLGAQFVINEPFTREFAALEAEAFLAHIKTYIPSLHSVYVGESWRFGRGRLGDVALLKKSGVPLGVEVTGVPHLNFGAERVSSTRIRALVTSGEIAAANELLGYAYFAEGTVIAGKQLGRTIGFPTLNLAWAPDCRPAYGVYDVTVYDKNTSATRRAIANYGVRPTAEKAVTPQLEVHVLSDCPWSTGSELRIEFHRFIRSEKNFSSLEALRQQIAADIASILD